MFITTEVEKSQTGKPIVNPGSDNVAMWGAPISPQEEKGLGFPPRGIPWLVDSISQPKINVGKVAIFA